MRQRALITGATGFVGSHLAERLVSEGWQVRAMVRAGSDTSRLTALGAELRRGDLGDVEALRSAAGGVDVVYHLAATTFGRSEADFTEANVVGTQNLMQAVRTAEPRPRRIVYLSSYAACGPADANGVRAMHETPAPLTAYGRTKLAGEAEVRAGDGFGATAVIIRAPAVYGPGDRALLSYFRLVKWGLAPSPSGGAARIHVVYAPDLARALARAAVAPSGTYAVAEPVEHSWEALVRAMSAALGRRPLRVSLPAPLVRAAAAATQAVGGLAGRSVPFNREKAEEMLAAAWVCDLDGSDVLLPPEEVTPLAEGIARTVAWYKRQGWL